MSRIEHTYPEFRFPGLSGLFEARARMVQKEAELETDFERDNYFGREHDDEKIKKKKRYSEVIEKLDSLIQWILPDWKYDPEAILNTMNSFSLTVKDAWWFEIASWKCHSHWDDNKASFSKADANEKAAGYVTFGTLPPCAFGETSIQAFISKLKELNVLIWRPHYEPPLGTFVLDGFSWELKIESPEGYLIVTGDNGYPDEYDAAIEYLNSICSDQINPE